jgi:hypothetical protein
LEKILARDLVMGFFCLELSSGSGCLRGGKPDHWVESRGVSVLDCIRGVQNLVKLIFTLNYVLQIMFSQMEKAQLAIYFPCFHFGVTLNYFGISSVLEFGLGFQSSEL